MLSLLLRAISHRYSMFSSCLKSPASLYLPCHIEESYVLRRGRAEYMYGNFRPGDTRKKDLKRPNIRSIRNGARGQPFRDSVLDSTFNTSGCFFFFVAQVGFLGGGKKNYKETANKRFRCISTHDKRWTGPQKSVGTR